MKKHSKLIISLFLILTTVILSLQYPDAEPLGEKLFLSLGIPVWSNRHSGFNYLGIFMAIIFIASLLLLKKSLRKHQKKTVFLVGVLILWMPSHLITGYQTFFAKGIYTLEYVRNSGTCTYKSEDPWITGKCTMTFINHGRNDVNFSAAIRNVNFPDISFLESLNVISDQILSIHPHETKTITVDFTKWAGNIGIPQSGSYSGVNLRISDGTSQRNL